jgi:hypothetical protein
MKKIFLWGTFALFSSTIYSCTADEYDGTSKTTKVKTEQQASYPDGPGDEPIIVPPPKKP